MWPSTGESRKNLATLAAIRALATSRAGRIIAAALTVLAAVAYAVELTRRQELQDFGAYYRGAWRAIHHGSPYDSGPLVESMPFLYPPVAALLLAPLTWWSESGAELPFTLVSIAALVWTLWLLVGSSLPARRHAERPALTLVALLAALASEPVWSTLGLGQINLILVALVVTDVVVLGDRRWFGALIGLAAAIKLVPVVFIGYLAITRRWRALATAVGAAVLATLVGAIAMPHATWAYVRDGTALHGIGEGAKAANQSLYGVAERVLGNGGAATAAWIVASLVVVAGCVAITPRVRERFGDLAGVATVAAAALLVGPIAWTHYWVWWLLLPAVAAHPGWRQRVAPAAGAATVAAITLFGRRWFPPYDEFARAHPSAAEQLADACYVLTALGTLAGLAWAVARPRSAAADCDGDTPPNAVSDSRSAEGA